MSAKYEHQQRVAFLNLKNTLGTITRGERAELQRLASLRVIETTGGGPVLILPPEDTLQSWKAQLAARNEAERERRAHNHENT